MNTNQINKEKKAVAILKQFKESYESEGQLIDVTNFYYKILKFFEKHKPIENEQ